MNTNYRSTKTISGSGAAHGAGLMLFGRRGPLLNEADAGGSSAPAQPAPAAAPVETPPQAGKFTPEQQEEINRIAARAREEGRKAALKSAPAPAPAPTPREDEPEKVSKKELQAQIEELRLRGVFDKHAARAGIPDDASDDLFALFKMQKPDDARAWFDTNSVAKAFKASSQAAAPVPAASTQPATPTATPAPEAPKPPAAAPAAPATSHALPTVNGAIDLWNLTPAQLAALGPSGVRTELEKLVKIGDQMQGRPQRPQLPNRQR